jgi:hypothetical protein
MNSLHLLSPLLQVLETSARDFESIAQSVGNDLLCTLDI